MLGLLVGNKEAWQSRIDRIAGSRLPLLADRSGRPDPAFPWLALRTYTDAYLRKRKNVAASKDRDAHCARLIVEYKGSKAVAVAACGHVMNTAALENLLKCIQWDVHDHHFEYFSAAYAASKVCDGLVELDDLARAFIPLMGGSLEDSSAHLKTALTQMESVATDSTLLPCLEELIGQICIRVRTHLGSLVNKSRWQQASKDTQWMQSLAASIVGLPNAQKIKLTLYKNFMDWGAWASWQPDRKRLQLWAEELSDIKTLALREVLRLEGPDTATQSHTTHAQALLEKALQENAPGIGPSRSSTDVMTTSINDLGATFQKTLCAVDQACRLGEPFKRLLVFQLGGKKPGTELGKLDLVDQVNATEDNMVALVVWELLQKQPDVSVVLQALPSLGAAKVTGVRPFIIDPLVQLLHTEMGRLQLMALNFILYAENLGQNMTAAVEELHSFGVYLAAADWLHPRLHVEVLNVLNEWPDEREMANLLALWHEILRLGGQEEISEYTKQYFIHRLFSRSSSDVDYNLVTALLNILESEPSRIKLALRIAGGAVNGETQSFTVHCIKQLTVLSQELIQALEGMLTSSESNRIDTVVSFAEQLASESNKSNHDTWGLVLGRAIDKIEDFAEMALVNLGTKGFVQLYDDFRKIFWKQTQQNPHRAGVHRHPVLCLSMNTWICKQLKDHLAIIEGFELAKGICPAMRCIMLTAGAPYAGRTAEYILASFRQFEMSKESRPEATELRAKIFHQILAQLEFDGGNAHRVYFTIEAVLNDKVSFCKHEELEEIAFVLEQLEDNPVFYDIRPEFCEIMIAGAAWKPSKVPVKSVAGSSSPLNDGAGNNVVEHIYRWTGEMQDKTSTFNAKGSSPQTRLDISVLGKLYDLPIQSNSRARAQSSQLVCDVLISELKTLLIEATRLESLRLAFKELDPIGMVSLLEDLGIEDDLSLQRLLNDLPEDVLESVELVSDDELEIHIPLSGFTAFQKAAMGHSAAKAVLVRLRIDLRVRPATIGFCVHLDDEVMASSATSKSEEREGLAKHTPHMCKPQALAPKTAYCHGRLTPTVYQISRLLASHLSQGFTNVTQIHSTLTKLIDPKNLFQSCIVCSSAHVHTLTSASSLHNYMMSSTTVNVRYNRSTVCHMAACKDVLNRSSLEVSLSYIRQDPNVARLLLAGIHAATLNPSQAHQVALLPACPIPTMDQLRKTLTALPRILDLHASQDLQTAIIKGAAGISNANFLRWALASTTYKGYLVSVSGQLRLPGLPPGIDQFCQAHAAPDQEAAFARRLQDHSGVSQVMFHGTTLDRLFSILVHGLQEKSGTAFQQNGQSYGKGVYLAEEMSTAFTYSNSLLASTVGVAWSGAEGRFGSSIRVLLACEVAGPSTAATYGIHVLKDASRVVVRYVFICGVDCRLPVSRHVVPAMQSVFKGLRAGTI